MEFRTRIQSFKFDQSATQAILLFLIVQVISVVTGTKEDQNLLDGNQGIHWSRSLGLVLSGVSIGTVFFLLGSHRLFFSVLFVLNFVLVNFVVLKIAHVNHFFTNYSSILLLIIIANHAQFYYKIKSSTIKIKFGVKPGIFLYLFVLAYLIFFTFLSLEYYYNYHSVTHDLGVFTNSIYHIIHDGNSYASIFNIMFLSQHLVLVLYLIVPFFYLVQKPEVLLIIQTICIACGGIYVFRIAKAILQNDWVSLAFCLSYLLSPVNQGTNLFDFHEVGLLNPFVLGFFYYSLTNQNYWKYSFCAIALMIKEDVVLTLFIFQVVSINRNNLRSHIFTLIVFVLYYLVSKNILTSGIFYSRYSDFVFDPKNAEPSLVLSVLCNPLYTFNYVFGNSEKVLFLFQILIPTLALSLFSRKYILVMIPVCLYIFLTSYQMHFSTYTHNPMPIVSVLFLTSIFGLKNLVGQDDKQLTIFAILIVLNSISVNIFFGRSNLQELRNLSSEKMKLRKAIYDQIKNMIPENASVSCPTQPTPNFSFRDSVYTLGQLNHGVLDNDSHVLGDHARYVIFDNMFANSPGLENSLEKRKALNRLVQEKNYGVIFHKYGVRVLKKGESKTSYFQDSLTFFAEELNQFENLDYSTLLNDSSLTIISNRAVDEHGDANLTFGPYIQLNPGRHKLVLSYMPLEIRDEKKSCFRILIREGNEIFDTLYFLGSPSTTTVLKKDSVEFQLQKSVKNLEFITSCVNRNKVGLFSYEIVPIAP